MTKQEIITNLTAATNLTVFWLEINLKDPNLTDEFFTIRLLPGKAYYQDDKLVYQNYKLEISFTTTRVQHKYDYRGILKDLFNAVYITEYFIADRYYTVYTSQELGLQL